MKIRLLFIVTLLAGIVSACGEKDIAVFEGRNQIYFEKFYMNALYPGTKEADTTRTSFFFFPENTKEIKVKLVVNLSGLELEKDLHFGLKTVEEGTTAKPEEYRLEKEYTFRKRALPTDMKEVKDTIEVSVLHSDRLAELGTDGVRLVVELGPNADVDLGQYERRRAVIVWSEVEAKPDWWTHEVEWTLLGAYSYEKYKLFLQVVDTEGEFNENLIKNYPARAIAMVTEFKQWLLDHLNDPEHGAEYKKILDSLKV